MGFDRASFGGCMAAFHFSAKIIARSGGARSAVRAAAYRSGSRIIDERTGDACDYTRKQDVYRTEIFAPDGAPDWVRDRSELWNRVEARERRKDAQLAQEYELNLPREFSNEANWDLVSEFVKTRLVVTGRIADVAMHCATASDGEAHTHVHILMPMRLLDGDKFGDKHPDIDRRTFFQNRDRITAMREDWCVFVRERAAERGIDLGPDWDHRSLEDRNINLEPQPKIGATAFRIDDQKGAAERTAEYNETIARNGERLLADPGIALTALTAHAATFTERDLARYINRHASPDQFAEILAKAQAAARPIGTDEHGQHRFSTDEMIALEARMARDADALAVSTRHVAAADEIEARLAASKLSDEQREAARHILIGGDLSALVGFAGAGKSTMLSAVREVLEAEGFNVKGGALSGIAAQNLEQGSDIEARTLASWAYAWAKGKDTLTDKDILVIDEAGMIGSRQLAHMLGAAREAGAKIVLVGDAEQLQAIEAGAAFRAVTERVGHAELTTVHRQQEEWQREATRELATGQTEAALARYYEAGSVTEAGDHAAARAAIVEKWLADHAAEPDASQLILAHTRADVRAINEQVRGQLREAGEIDSGIDIDTARGLRNFGAGDRLLFLRNDRELGVKNGTLGWVEKADIDQMIVRTDDGRAVHFDPATYQDLDHGYAVTVHKSQGVTVDKSYVLASDGFDRHLAYVALSRHRFETELVYSRGSFENFDALAARLGRERAKDTTLDYVQEMSAARRFIEPDPKPEPVVDPLVALAEERRRRAEELDREQEERRLRQRSRDRDWDLSR